MRMFATVGTVVAVTLLCAASAVADTVLVENAHSGSHYAATNTRSSGGGIYQDVSLSTTAGQLVCASAWLRTQLPATGASGTFSLYLRGTSAVNAGATSYSGLGNLGDWTQTQTCVEATGSHSSLRIQVYPTPGSPTTELDDVNVTQSLATNGGFEDGGGPWRPYPGTRSNYVVYANAPGAPPAYSGTHFAAINTAIRGRRAHRGRPAEHHRGRDSLRLGACPHRVSEHGRVGRLRVVADRHLDP